MTNRYAEFIESKRIVAPSAGIRVEDAEISQQLFPFQRDIVSWALRRGRAAIWADCGLGKTPCQLEWARLVCAGTGRNCLIMAPLAVSRQTQREGEKFGVPVTVCRSQGDARPGVNITNYEMLSHFDPTQFGSIVLDESSILKGFDGSVRRELTQFASGIPYRLACTATPAPNDLIELTNHSEFLGVMSGKEIIALFFAQDGNTTHAWRLKGHARTDFWAWLGSWAVALRRPSDIGYSDDGFILPPLRMHQVTVEVDAPLPGSLFTVEATTLDEQRMARKASLADRVAACAGLVNASQEPWLVWCDLNDESSALAKAIPDAVEVRGSDSGDHKEDALTGFAAGRYRVIVTKPSIAGFGMNFQHCAHVAFVGLSHSYEALYQAIRRCWRFGQQRPVECYVITSDAEGAVVRNIERKEAQANEMMQQMVAHMARATGRGGRDEMPYRPAVPMRLPEWLPAAA